MGAVVSLSGRSGIQNSSRKASLRAKEVLWQLATNREEAELS